MKNAHMPPGLDRLILEKKDTRAEKYSTAVVIPTKDRMKMLEEHIRALEKQNIKEFNIIVVYGKNDSFIERNNILHIRESGSGGCAGAFYIGERIALDEGYKNIILADDDCLPVSENLVKKIVHSLQSGNKVVLPHVRYGRQYFHFDVIHHYGGISRDVFEKAGLTFLPLEFGGEDFELKNRMEKNGFRIARVSAEAQHMTDEPIVIEKESRAYCYARGGFISSILSGYYMRAYFGAFFHLFAALTFYLSGRKELGNAYLYGILDASGLEIKKNPITDTARPVVDADDIDVTFSYELSSHFKYNNLPSYESYIWVILSWMEKGILTILHCRRILNRNVLFVEMYDPNFMLIITLSKNSYVRFNGRVYRIDSEKSLLRNMAGFILQLFSIFPIGIAAFFLMVRAAIIKKVRKIDTQGYGV